jgi:hypothetical protein
MDQRRTIWLAQSPASQYPPTASFGYASSSSQARTFVTNPPPLPPQLSPNRSESSLQAIDNAEVKRALNQRNEAGAYRPRSGQGAKAEAVRQDQPEAPGVKEKYGDHDQDDVIPHDTPVDAPYQRKKRMDSLTPCPNQPKHSNKDTTTMDDISTSLSGTTLLESSQRTGETILDSNESTNTRSKDDDNVRATSLRLGPSSQEPEPTLLDPAEVDVTNVQVRTPHAKSLSALSRSI